MPKLTVTLHIQRHPGEPLMGGNVDQPWGNEIITSKVLSRLGENALTRFQQDLTQLLLDYQAEMDTDREQEVAQYKAFRESGDWRLEKTPEPIQDNPDPKYPFRPWTEEERAQVAQERGEA